MIPSSALLSVVVPRALRMNLLVRLIMPWLLPAWAATTRPVAVTLNRFLQLDFVFILGISGSFSKSVGPHDSACHVWPVLRIERAVYADTLICARGGLRNSRAVRYSARSPRSAAWATPTGCSRQACC